MPPNSLFLPEFLRTGWSHQKRLLRKLRPAQDLRCGP